MTHPLPGPFGLPEGLFLLPSPEWKEIFREKSCPYQLSGQITNAYVILVPRGTYGFEHQDDGEKKQISAMILTKG